MTFQKEFLILNKKVRRKIRLPANLSETIEINKPAEPQGTPEREDKDEL